MKSLKGYVALLMLTFLLGIGLITIMPAQAEAREGSCGDGCWSIPVCQGGYLICYKLWSPYCEHMCELVVLGRCEF